jgi:carboxymethylenebutenolidase
MGKSIRSRRPPPNLQNRSFRRMVDFGTRRTGGTGYMVHSDRVGPGVVILHEFFGLQQSFMSYADALNEQGFTVLAPDLYDGVVADSIDTARALAQSLDVERTTDRVKAAFEHLQTNWHPLVGVVGFSLGASLAVGLAQELRAEAVVLYYGLGDFDPDHWTAPCLGHFAEQDEWEPRAHVEAEFARLESLDLDVEMHLYPGVGHWFANSDVPSAYDAPAAQLAFQRTADFLHHHLS